MPGRFNVLTMPDIFLDHYLIAGSREEFLRKLRSTASTGSRMRVDQRLALGGNAYYFALNAARLGCSVTLLARADRMMLAMLKREIGLLDISAAFVADGFEPSLTVALEFTDRHGGSSININDPGSLRAFGKEDFPEALLNEEFDLVSVFNLTNNSKGAQLASHVFRSFRGLKLMDLPDPSSSFSDADGLRAAVEQADLLTGNFAEVMHACRLLKLEHSGSISRAAIALSGLGPRTGVHSATRCLEAMEGEITSARVHTLEVPSTTGAGDAWTAAYAYSVLSGDKPPARLEFANRHAAAFLLQRARD